MQGTAPRREGPTLSAHLAHKTVLAQFPRACESLNPVTFATLHVHCATLCMFSMISVELSSACGPVPYPASGRDHVAQR